MPHPARRLALAVTALGLTIPTTVLAASPAEARTPSKLTVSGPKKAQTQTKVTFRGKVRSGNTRRVVRVQTRAPGSKKWTLVRKVRTTKKGAFTVKVASGKKAGKRQVRFTAPATKKFKKAQVRRVVKVRRPAAAKGGLRVTWQRTKVTAGAGVPFRVTGTVPRGWKRQQVLLQRKHADGWKKAGSAKVTAKGTFAVTARGDWLHSLPYRVRVVNPKTKKPVTSAKRRFTASPDWKPTGNASAYAHFSTTFAGKVHLSRWNPCSPVTYRVNLAQAQAGQTLGDIHKAVGEVALATGLRFKYLGPTTAHGFGAIHTPQRPRDTDLVISWSRRDQLDSDIGKSFAPNTATIGLGGHVPYPARDSRGPALEARDGSVAMRSEWNWAGNRQAAYIAMVHELGHVVGLDHVRNNPTQLMNSTLTPQTPSRWGAGDLTGLSKVGFAQGCLKPGFGGRSLTAPDATGDAPAPTWGDPVYRP